MPKVCPKCCEEKDINSFYNNKLNKDGKSFYCKECHNSYFTKDIRREKSRKFRAKNPDYQKQWNRKNKDRRREYDKRWRESNRNTVNAKNKARLHRAKIQTPEWANLVEIRAFYVNCPEGYHVDHIVPLNGEAVSGLHVIENLQYLPSSENLKKSNIFKGE